MRADERTTGAVPRRVVVADYDRAWPAIFQALRATIWPVVRDVAMSLEHIGSTSVPGLSAKPIINMTLVVPSPVEVPLAINRLATIGYGHRGDLGIPEREAFHRPPGTPAHHLYVCPAGSLGLINPLTLRDYLRAHPEAARGYAELKYRLAEEFRDDPDGYTAAKTGFIVETLRLAGLADDQLAAVRHANQRPPDVLIRPATADDAAQVADVYLTARKSFLPYAPLGHSDDDVRHWVAQRLIPAGGVAVALAGERQRAIVGMMACSRADGIGWIDHLYLSPAVVGRGIGTRLARYGQAQLGPPIRLYTFQANHGARRFYEQLGFRAIAFSDGAANEERCPDVLYEWTGT